jgi:hypothetical protein
MSVSFGCHCAERRKPPEQRQWVVLTRRGNNSAFNGYRFESSAYSEVYCQNCGAMGRTKGAFVDQLRDAEKDAQLAAPLDEAAAAARRAGMSVGTWAGLKRG